MYAVATRLESPSDILEALEKLILLSPDKEVRPYFAQYRQLKDSLETARNGAKNQFALIRYDVEKNKAENLSLQRENAEKKTEVVQQRAVTAGVILVLVLVIAWGIGWYRKRKQRMVWEKEKAKQEERLHISKKVHDVVANGIYRVAKQVEEGTDVGSERVADQLWDLYDKSRNISYEHATTADGDFQSKVSELLSAYGTPDRKVLITGNEENVWEDVGLVIKEQLGPILEELMVNLDKHSGARNLVVRFDLDGKGLTVQYTDDGVGFPTKCRFGNGLTNTGNRIEALGGRISFEPNIPTGLKICIYLPND
jgi:signal transduction histidine kinase